MADTSKLVEELSGLTVLEVADLVKELEEKWGVSAAAPVAVAAAAGPFLPERSRSLADRRYCHFRFHVTRTELDPVFLGVALAGRSLQG